MDELERRQIANTLNQLKENLDRAQFNADTGMDTFVFETTNESALLNAIGYLRDYTRNVCKIIETLVKEIAK